MPVYRKLFAAALGIIAVFVRRGAVIFASSDEAAVGYPGEYAVDMGAYWTDLLFYTISAIIMGMVFIGARTTVKRITRKVKERRGE